MASTIPHSMPPNFNMDILANLQQHFATFPNLFPGEIPHPLIVATMLAKMQPVAGIIPSPNSAFLQPNASGFHHKRLELEGNKSPEFPRDAKVEISTPAPSMSTLISPTPDEVENEIIGDTHLDGDDKPKRRNRLGGSSVKTAEVWRFFQQLSPQEQAAKCQVVVKKNDDGTEEQCNKTIKATNSSTTGMIRHLRSCHPPEYKILQEARKNTMIMKAIKSAPDEAARNEMLLQIQKLEMCSPSAAHSALLKVKAEKTESYNAPQGGLLTPQPKHTVDSIIGNHAESSDANILSTTWPVRQGQASHPLRLQDSAGSCLDNFFEMLKNGQPQEIRAEMGPTVVNEKAAQKRAVDVESSDNKCEQSAGLNATPRRQSDFQPKRIKIESMEESENVNRKPAGPNMAQAMNDAETVKEICTTPERTTQLKKTRRVKPECQFWSEESKDAKKLTEKIALMLVIDNQAESMVEQKGFKDLIHALVPKYRLPSAKDFAEKFVPQVKKQLQANIELMHTFQYELQRNNPFGFGKAVLQSTTNSVPRTSPHDRSGVSPATTVESVCCSVESGYHEDRDDIENCSTSSSTGGSSCRGKSENIDAVVQHSIISAQNISQSFSSSIELSSSGIGEMDSDDGATSDETVADTAAILKNLFPC